MRESGRDRLFRLCAKAGHPFDGVGGDGRRQIGCARDAQLPVHARKLFNRHRARLEQPAEIGGKVSHGRLEENPAARIVDVTETRQRLRAHLGRRLIKQRCQVGLGVNLTGTNECRRFGEPRRLVLVPPDGCDRRKLVERLLQRDR
jgi:hypothetical protein